MPSCLRALRRKRKTIQRRSNHAFCQRSNQTFVPFIVPVCLAPGENSVVILQFGKWFDRFLAGVSLPCGLQELRFGTKFNEPLDNVDLPVTLQTLELGSGFQQSLRMLSCPKAFKLSDADRRAALSACSRQSYFASRRSAFSDCVRYIRGICVPCIVYRKTVIAGLLQVLLHILRGPEARRLCFARVVRALLALCSLLLKRTLKKRPGTVWRVELR